MLSGKDKSGLVCINAENLAQAAPIDSLHCSKSRIALGRESIWDIGKNARWNLSLSSSQSPFVLSTACVYHSFTFSMREKGNNFHFRVSYVMPEMLRHEHISSNSCMWWHGFSFSTPEKGCARTMAFRLGWSSLPDESFGFEGGLGNSPFEAEGYEVEVGFMVKKVKRKYFCFYKKDKR